MFATLRSPRLVMALLAALLTASAAARPDAHDSAAASTNLPTLSLADCLRIANERQPTLAAARASLAARQAAQRGVSELRAPAFLALTCPSAAANRSAAWTRLRRSCIRRNTTRRTPSFACTTPPSMLGNNTRSRKMSSPA